MKDFNNHKTIEIMRQNRMFITFRMIIIVGAYIALTITENIVKNIVNFSDKPLITAVFIAIRLFLYVPFLVGNLRDIFCVTREKVHFPLCYFLDFKSYFSVVFSALMTIVFILLIQMLLFFLYSLASVLFFDSIIVKISYIVTVLLSVFYLVLKIFTSLTYAFEQDTEKFLIGYITKLGKKGVIDCVKHLSPCIPRLLLMVFIFPTVYVLPFTMVRMSLRYK